MSQRFAKLDDFTVQEAQSARTKSFTGNGTSFLMVSSPEEPNLLKLEAIRIGVQTLPLTQTRQYPVNGQLQLQTVEEPLVELQTRSDGAQFLVRAVITNDGIWTDGITVYVTAEWGVASPAVPVDDLTRLESLAERQAPSDSGESALNAVAMGTGVPPVVPPLAPPLHAGGPSAEDVAVAAALSELPADVLEALKKLGEPRVALAATNEQYNAVGIKGPAIIGIKNTLRRALGVTA